MKQILFLILTILTLASCNNNAKKTTEIKKDATLSQLDSILNADPTNSEAYYVRSNYFMNKMQLSEATTDINKAIELDSTIAKYYVTVADLHLIFRQRRIC